MGNPEATNAANEADAPGIDSTRQSEFIAALISLYAGSLIPGVPASVISAKFSPLIKFSISFGILLYRLCS